MRCKSHKVRWQAANPCGLDRSNAERAQSSPNRARGYFELQMRTPTLRLKHRVFARCHHREALRLCHGVWFLELRVIARASPSLCARHMCSEWCGMRVGNKHISPYRLVDELLRTVVGLIRAEPAAPESDCQRLRGFVGPHRSFRTRIRNMSGLTSRASKADAALRCAGGGTARWGERAL